MQLYVNDKTTNEKIYIKNLAPTRKALSNAIASNYIIVNNQKFSINDIKAEASVNSNVTTVIGGTVGLLGGFWGAVAGATLGNLYGKNELEEDNKKVHSFNESEI